MILILSEIRILMILTLSEINTYDFNFSLSIDSYGHNIHFFIYK